MRYSRIVAVDTETEAIEGFNTPRLACISIATEEDGVTSSCVYSPEEGMSRLTALRLKQDTLFVCHNLGFDFRVLQAAWQKETAYLLYHVLPDWWDTMLMDQLIRIARGDPYIGGRGLDKVGEEWGNFHVNKDDPWRMRYGELIGVPLQDWPQEAIDYARDDATATLRAAQAMYPEMLRWCAKVGLTEDSLIVKKWGPLTIGLQSRVSVALADIGATGIRVDGGRAVDYHERLSTKVEGLRKSLENLVPGIWKRYKVNRPKQGMVKGGAMLGGKHGTPKMDQGILQEHLGEVARAKGLRIRNTPTGRLGMAAEDWEEHREEDPAIGTWIDLMESAKLCQFTAELVQRPRVQSRYHTLVGTGRASSSGMNIQQMPRDPELRSLFVAEEGHRLICADYSCIEMVAVAAVCLRRYGRSQIAEVLKKGVDPHSYTACLLNGWDVDSPPTGEEFKKARQGAKVVNFGILGGLQPPNLIKYAKRLYGLNMTLEEATYNRDTLIHRVYPELAEYLRTDYLRALCFGTQKTPAYFQKKYGGKLQNLWLAARSLSKHAMKFFFVSPQKEAEGRTLAKELALELSPPETDLDAAGLKYRLFPGFCLTLTGRLRGGLEHTQVLNTAFQGLAADGAKSAVFEMWRAGLKVVAFVHDEVVVEAPFGEEEKQAELVHHIMVNRMVEVLQEDVPVKVEVSICDNWGEK